MVTVPDAEACQVAGGEHRSDGGGPQGAPDLGGTLGNPLEDSVGAWTQRKQSRMAGDSQLLVQVGRSQVQAPSFCY
jgi:hypothetical protein